MEHEEEMQREAAFFCSLEQKDVDEWQAEEEDRSSIGPGASHHMSWIDESTARPKQTRTLCIQMCVVHKFIDQELQCVVKKRIAILDR